MKYRTERITETVPHTVDGVTVDVQQTREIRVPVLPRDWDAVAVRAVHGLVVGLTLVSVTWSTDSIAHLLGGTWVSYLAAGVFDASWMTALGLAYVVRHRPDRRALPDRLGWFLLAVTVAALLVEGHRSGSIATALVGAAVSVVAKSLWWCLGHATAPELSDADAQWVRAQLSDANARMAVASVRRQVARIEDRAAAELLALEASRRAHGIDVPAVFEPAEVDSMPVPTIATEQAPELPIAAGEPATALAVPEPAAEPVPAASRPAAPPAGTPRTARKQVKGAGRTARPAKTDAAVLEELAEMRTGVESPLSKRAVCAQLGIGPTRLDSLLQREGLTLDPIPLPTPRPLRAVEADQDDAPAVVAR